MVSNVFAFLSAPKKAPFHVNSLLGDLVIRTNLVWIVPRAFRSFHDHCPIHIRILTMFTGIFRAGEVVDVSWLLLSVSSLSFSVSLSLSCLLQLHCHSQKLSPLALYLMNFLHCSRSRKYFLHFGSLFFISNHLGRFCSWLRPYRLETPQDHLKRYSAHKAW